jgi:hypothetical protein
VHPICRDYLLKVYIQKGGFPVKENEVILLDVDDLEEELIEITPVVNREELSDSQDLPEVGASLSYIGCCSYRSSTKS